MSNRIVQMPPVESFGRLTPDKWLALKNPVSVLSNVFGKPSHTFDPCDYTRFAPEDNYTKKADSSGGFWSPDPPCGRSGVATITRTRRKPVFGRGGDSKCLLAART